MRILSPPVGHGQGPDVVRVPVAVELPHGNEDGSVPHVDIGRAHESPETVTQQDTHGVARDVGHGKVGVAIDSLADLRTLFAGIPLGDVTTSMTINSTAAILLLLYQLVAEEHGVTADRIRGTTQNDILKEYIARGTYIYPPAASLRLTSDVFAWCRDELNTALVTTEPWQTLRHSFSHYDLDIRPILVRVDAPLSRVADSDSKTWYRLDDPPPGGMAAPVRKLIEQLKKSSNVTHN